MRLPRLPRVRPLLVAVAAAGLIGLAGGGWLWLRDSSLVAVQHVTVIGASGPEGPQIRAALIRAARGMTTLDVGGSSLRTAVAPFPVVKDLRIATEFPHGLRIRVVEQLPVAAVVAGGQRVAASADGTLLRQDAPSPTVPTVAVPEIPGGSRLTDPHTLSILAVLGSAPYQLLARVGGATETGPHGVVIQLRSGPSVYFGDAAGADAKWTAAATVIADPGAAGAGYIDVSDPQRPAAGG